MPSAPERKNAHARMKRAERQKTMAPRFFCTDCIHCGEDCPHKYGRNGCSVSQNQFAKGYSPTEARKAFVKENDKIKKRLAYHQQAGTPMNDLPDSPVRLQKIEAWKRKGYSDDDIKFLLEST